MTEVRVRVTHTPGAAVMDTAAEAVTVEMLTVAAHGIDGLLQALGCQDVDVAVEVIEEAGE